MTSFLKQELALPNPRSGDKTPSPPVLGNRELGEAAITKECSSVKWFSLKYAAKELS